MTSIANPLITIITVTLNSERYLEDTIKSVIQQTYPLIEYIIVDGQSSDGTLDIVKKYAPKIHRWISEPDSGITEAMNKGIAMASGDFILFLHSDDYLFENNSIEKAVRFMNENIDIFAFSILFKTQNKTISSKSSWNWLFNFKTQLFHQGVLCQRNLFHKIGLFDTQFKIAMDYDFFLRAYRKQCSIKIIEDFSLTVMRDMGISSRKDWNSLSKRFAEEKRVHYKNTHTFLGRAMYFTYWQLYLPYRRIRYLLKRNT